MIKILLVDDHEIIREGLKMILKEADDMLVVGEAQNGVEAMERIVTTKCDVVVLDMNMPGRSGIELLSDIKTEFPYLNILVLSIHPEEKLALRAIKAGASGYLCKDTALEELVKAIYKIHSKGRYISSNLAEQLVFDIMPDSTKSGHKQLSKREQLILSKIAIGIKAKDIAEELGLSLSTVFTYRTRIFEKLNVSSNIELAHYAIDNRLII